MPEGSPTFQERIDALIGKPMGSGGTAPDLGEVVSSSNTLESISEEKKTRLGSGHFVTWVTTYRDEQGEVVGRQRFRVLKFKPGGDAR